jgi:hypothetical protein
MGSNPSSVLIGMRQCTHCNMLHEDSFFAFRDKAKNILRTACKACTRAMSKKHYGENSSEYLDRNRARKRSNKQIAKDYVLKYLREHPCVVCGEDDILVLVFDHLDPKTKKAAVGTMRMRGFSLAMIQAEIAKCQVLCCNCHTRRTSHQFNWWKLCP